MLRTLPRASSSSSILSKNLRTAPFLGRPAATCLLNPESAQKRSASGHAISNPTLAGIEKRWEGMPPQEQADLWMALRDRMKVDWHEMTLQEKKAGKLHFLSDFRFSIFDLCQNSHSSGKARFDGGHDCCLLARVVMTVL